MPDVVYAMEYQAMLNERITSIMSFSLAKVVTRGLGRSIVRRFCMLI